MDVPHTWVGPRTHGEKWRKPGENKELDLTKISLSKRYNPKTEAGDPQESIRLRLEF